jgi:peptide-methionine (S)-S-oxide reductase
MIEKATFGAGCFWHVELAFSQLQGVTGTRAGYMGGTKEHPTYEQVCTKTTGHAEVVEVSFDPELVSYEALLQLFWEIHDPTQLNRQGPDIGSNYRSAIFFHTEAQQQAAHASLNKEERSGRYARPIVTEITPAGVFWPAEEYHQQYLAKRGRGSCTL